MTEISPNLLFVIFLALAAATVLVFRLVPRSRGSLRATPEAEEAFTAGEADPDYRYYAAGSEAHPSALLMLRDDWSLEGGWRELTDPERDLPAAVEGMLRLAADRNRPLHASDLLDPHGMKIGAWYGPLGPQPAIRFREGRHLSIDTTQWVHEP
ncbi:MAG: hypothetical protein HPY65_00460 [Syntrophaceae bacterium]|nr:hypothetical protein [Syntrophaceae bacterium]